MTSEDYLNYGNVSIQDMNSFIEESSARDLADRAITCGRIVQLESPFSPSNGFPLEHNLRYARRALRDSIFREETPYASHLLYTQEGVLNDDVQDERDLGIQTGFRLLRHGLVSMSVVYSDFGLSRGMIDGIRVAIENDIHVQFRFINSFFDSYSMLLKLEELMEKVARP